MTDKKEILQYLFFITIFFILLEVSFFIQCNQVYFEDYRHVANKITIPWAIWPGVLYFFVVQLILHGGYCLAVWLVTLSLIDLFQINRNQSIFVAISVWFIGIATVLMANQVYFPNSKFVDLNRLFFSDGTAYWILLFFELITALLVTLSIFSLLKKMPKPIIYLTGLMLILFGLSFFKPSLLSPKIQDASSVERPNIIFIGVDSLRPDFLALLGQETSTPFLDSFLKKSSVFTDAVTPLARTFPSWMSILSGQHPKRLGIRSNLADQRGLKIENTLPTVLHRLGYENIYATDETRFNNIDSSQGFDKTITPPIGLNDFLIGTFNDFPLSNLLVNTFIGKWLFPYSYGNRPVYFTYQPNTFLKQIKENLSTHRTQPIFLAVHFCLPHHPYLWAGLSPVNLNPREMYVQSIARVDQQIKDFFVILDQFQLLKHAIVVVFSDHGETLEMWGDRITEKDLFLSTKKNHSIIPHFYPPSLDREEVNQSGGHGTDVLGLPQYHTLLAFRLYGINFQQIGFIHGIVSLLDIKPTVLDLIKIKENIKKSMNENRQPIVPDTLATGSSLARVIQGQEKKVALKHVIIESDYSPDSIRTIYPEVREVLLEGVELFQIDPVTTRLTVKPSMAKMIIGSKQYADLYDHWILALYPLYNHPRTSILVNLETGEWTNDLKTSFAMNSPALSMLKKLKDFYGDELNT